VTDRRVTDRRTGETYIALYAIMLSRAKITKFTLTYTYTKYVKNKNEYESCAAKVNATLFTLQH